MQGKIITNKKNFEEKIYKIKSDWIWKLHILADFDNTLTKAFSSWKLRPSLISILRSEWYLWEEYSKKSYELFEYYYKIELNPKIWLEEKKIQMTNWWNKSLNLLIESKLNKKAFAGPETISIIIMKIVRINAKIL